jgi:hypothetical protein
VRVAGWGAEYYQISLKLSVTASPPHHPTTSLPNQLPHFDPTLTPFGCVLEWGHRYRSYARSRTVGTMHPFSIPVLQPYTEALTMKFGSQIALALVAVVGLVAGVTYLSQFRVRPPEATKATPIARNKEPSSRVPSLQRVANELNFPMTEWKWESPTAGEFEMEKTAHEEFWFENPSPVDIELGVTSVNCKCSGLAFCILTEDQKKRYQRWASAAAAAELAAGAGGVLEEYKQLAAEQGATAYLHQLKMNWQEMKPDQEKGVLVPPQGGGLVRVSWKAKKGKIGEERLAIGLWSQAKLDTPTPRVDTRLEILVRLVPVVRALPIPIIEALRGAKDTSIGDLGPNEERVKEFVCWSSVRAGFSLTAEESGHDPCFACRCTPLTAEECRSLSTLTQQAGVPIRALSGYRVRVTVHERINDHVQMELGPFSRRIRLKSDPDVEDSFVTLNGVVRSDIAVGSEADEGRIVFKQSIPSRTGKSRVVKVSSPQAGLNLEVQGVEPASNFVKVKSLKEVKLTGIGGSHWELTVEIPPGSPPGKIPEHTAVILRISGTPPRSIRIPVVGTVYQRG